jgi:hypothetical protein
MIERSKRMKLQELLGEELHNQVTEKLGDNKLFLHKETDNVIISNNGEWLPSSKLEEKKTIIESLKTELSELKPKVEALKKDAGDKEEFEKKVNELTLAMDKTQVERDENERKIAEQITKKFKFRETLSNNFDVNPNYLDFIESKFKVDELPYENEKFLGLEEKINPLKEKFTEVFGTKEYRGESPSGGDSGTPSNKILELEKKLQDPNIDTVTRIRIKREIAEEQK